MKISREDVEKIASLARLTLSDAETKRYQAQLSDVLTYIAKLSEVDTQKVPPTAQVTGQTNVLADDAVRKPSDAKPLLRNAPAKQGGAIKVKSVFGG